MKYYLQQCVSLENSLLLMKAEYPEIKIQVQYMYPRSCKIIEVSYCVTCANVNK